MTILDQDNRVGVIRHSSILVTGLILIQVVLVAWRGKTESFVWDEVGHLASGISHLEFGRFDLYRVNPPLVRTVAAVGPWLAGYEPAWQSYSAAPDSRAEFTVGMDFVEANGARSFWLLTLARWCTIWVPILGAWICYRWSVELYGQPAGLVALSLWVFSPLVLANASLITADCGSASTGILAGYAFWRWLKQPGGKRAFLAGLAMGLALLTKSTWVVLFGLLPLMGIVWWVVKKWRPRPGDVVVGAYRYFGGLGFLLCTGLFVLNYGYGFESTLTPLGEYSFISKALIGDAGLVDRSNVKPGNRFADSWMGSIPVPVPKNYLMGIDVQRCDFENCERSYLRGEWREKGWWYYYLYGLWVKEPLATWVLFTLAIGSLFCVKRGWGLSLDELILLLPALAILVLVSSQTGMNHHVRYAMPVLPFLFVWISRVGRCMDRGPLAMRMLVVGLVIWGAVSSLRVFPHSITYFSEVVGGPANGHLHLHNSNLDWGQGLLHLKKWYDAHPEARPFFLVNSLPLIDPRIAGIEFEDVPTRSQLVQSNKDGVENGGLQGGWYAISVGALISSNDRYKYFADLTPLERVANVYWIFHLTEKGAENLESQVLLEANAGGTPGGRDN